MCKTFFPDTESKPEEGVKDDDDGDKVGEDEADVDDKETLGVADAPERMHSVRPVPSTMQS